MNASSGKLNLYLGVTKKVPDLAVAISFGSDCDQSALDALQCSGQHSSSKLDCSAVCYAVYLNVKQRLMGSALEVAKSRVADVKCGCAGKKFVISWATQGTGSALNKTLGEAMKAINPAKVFSTYKQVKKSVGESANREEFNYVVDALLKGFKVDACAVGRINTTKAKLNEIVKKAAAKLNLDKADSPKSKPQESKNQKAEKEQKANPVVKCSGLDACVVYDYLSSNSVLVKYANNGVEVLSGGWDSKHAQLKKADRISRFVAQKYVKLGEHFTPVMSYLAVISCSADASSVASFLRKNQKGDKMKEVIKKAL